MTKNCTKLLSLFLALLMTISPLSVCAEALAGETEAPVLAEEQAEEIPETLPEVTIPEVTVPEETQDSSEMPEEAPEEIPLPEATAESTVEPEPSEEPAEIPGETQGEQPEIEVSTGSYTDASLPDNDVLLDGFLHRGLKGGISAYNVTKLTGVDKEVYGILASHISGVAQHGGSATLFFSHTPGTVNTDLVFNALLCNMPYELYWFDKVNGWSILSTDQDMAITFQVAEEFQDSSAPVEYNYYFDNPNYPYQVSGPNVCVDPVKAAAAAATPAKAQAIVAANAGLDDYAKMNAYRQAICDLVSYNRAAADNNNYPYGNPWQLIWVFDGDSSTNVVCEGYSKAFKYLCDFSTWNDNSLNVHLVSGTMYSSGGSGPHMWNIVSTGGRNYLVDVTNCDSGSIGAPDKLFLKGATGSPESGYTSNKVNAKYIYSTYKPVISDLYDNSVLTLSSTDYVRQTTVGGTCGSGNTWSLDLDTGALTVSGSGEIVNPAQNQAPWAEHASKIRSVSIGSGITSISKYAFSGCTQLQVATLPGSITLIDDFAFNGCAALTRIALPSALKTLGTSAFSGTGITSVELPAGLTSAGTACFPDGTDVSADCRIEIDEAAFANCNLIKNHHIVTQVGQAPTCTLPGVTDKTYCDKCNTVMTEASELPALGHGWDEGTVTTEPDCLNGGIKTFACTRCDETYTQPLDALGHNEVTDAPIAPSCTEPGYNTVSHCDRCGVSMKKTDPVDPLGHNWDEGTVTAQPDCLNGGTKTFACTRCDETYTQPLDALGHNEVTDAPIAPSCTEPGYNTVSHCDRCGLSMKMTDQVAPLGHDWDEGTVTAEPDCLNDGTAVFACSRCEETDTRPVDALGHNEVMDEPIAPSCTEPGYNTVSHCDRCDLPLQMADPVDPLGHSWDEGVVTTEPDCLNGGIKTFACTRCDGTDAQPIDALGHDAEYCARVEPDFGADGHEEYWQCRRCGQLFRDEACTDLTTLEALWLSSSGTLVSYELDGGTNSPSNPDLIPTGTATIIKLKNPTRPGYAFLGWYTDAEWTQKITSITPDMAAQSGGKIRLFAKWQPFSFTVRFNLNGVAGKMPNETGCTDQYAPPVPSVPSGRFTFLGWNTKPNGTGNFYQAGDIAGFYHPTRDKSSITLYAVWSYTIGFDAMGGTGSMEPQDFKWNQAAPIAASSFARTGYTLKGWAVSSTAAAKGTIKYKPGASVKNIAGNTLYAVWQGNKYTVSFDANGGTGRAMKAQTFTWGTTKATALSACSYKAAPGYAFAGWNTDPDGMPDFAARQKVLAVTDEYVGDVTLYAIWRPTYTVTFHPNCATGRPKTQVLIQDVPASLTKNSFKNGTMTFTGWSTDPYGDVEYENTEKVLNLGGASDITLYAVWKTGYTVSFNANGGKGSMKSQLLYWGEECTLTANTFTRAGYYFAGWSTNPKAKPTDELIANEEITTGVTPTYKRTVRLYAVWEKIYP